MGSFDSLRYRDFRLFWSGAFLSNVGTWMQATALSWYVYELTRSAFWVSFVTFASLVPTVLAPIGGVMTDRFDRRKILLWTQSIMMVLAALLAVLVWTDHASLGVALAITFASGLVFTVNGPTWLAFVPSLVPADSMVNAIALNSTQFNAARVIGPAIGGVMVATVGAGPVFAINAVSFVAVLIAVTMIGRIQRTTGSRRGLGASLLGGFSYAWRHPRIRLLIVTTAVLSFFAGPVQALLPIYAARVFHRGAGGFGLLATAVGVGSVLGGLVLARLGTRTSTRTFAMAMLVVAVALASFAVIGWYPAGLVVIGVYGGAYLFTVASANSGIQLEVDEAMRGRVLSLFMLAWVAFPVGSLVAGALAQSVGVRTTTAVGAAACAVWVVVLLRVARRRPAAGESLRPAA